MPRRDLIQVRKGTAAQWTAANPILAAGELGLETDTGKIKGGNGTDTWSILSYSGSGGGGSSSWGSITGTLSSQTDLQTALNAKASTSSVSSGLATKQDTLVSGTNIRTVNGSNILGSGDLTISGATTVKTASVTLPDKGGVIEHIQTITDAGVSPTSKITLTLGSFVDDDENDPELLDILSMSAKPSSGAFDVTMAFAVETSGIIKLNYIIGA